MTVLHMHTFIVILTILTNYYKFSDITWKRASPIKFKPFCTYINNADENASTDENGMKLCVYIDICLEITICISTNKVNSLTSD